MIRPTEGMSEHTRRQNFLRFGVDIHIEVCPDMDVVRDGHHFPVYAVSWRTASGLHTTLLEPVLVARKRRSWLPFSFLILEWEVDEKATEDSLLARIRATQGNP